VTVGQWQPDQPPDLTDELVGRLAAAAARIDDPMLGLSADEIPRLAALMRHEPAAWHMAIKDRPSDDLVRLVRFFTVAEMRLRGWEAGARSPVIPIARELRRRGEYPHELTAWIREVSDNRFLPYGSLMDLL
jgi:hypothetical protein